MNKKNKKPLSKKELIEKLKAIASDETPRVKHHGAMCYIPICHEFICSTCGDDYSISGPDDGTTIRVMRIIKQMTELGFDVKVEAVCKSCAEKIKNELYPDGFGHLIHEINYIFFFRNSKDTEYHWAIMNSTFYYDALWTLIENGECIPEGLVDTVMSQLDWLLSL